MSVFQAVPALIGAYDPEFRERMPVSPEETCDESSARARARALPSEVRDLLDTLLLACGAGEPVDPRFRAPIDAVGEALWFHGFLLPQVRPRRGSTVDPRYYAASCRLTPALRRRRPLGEILLSPDQELNPGFPPSDARWDALVVAARLELDPPVLTKEGRMRKDTRERILKSLGDEWIRWDLAVRYAQATGLARKAGGRLLGFPEATPRALADPVAVLDDQDMPAGRVLLRLVHDDWLHMTELLQVLRDHCRWVLHSPEGEAYAESPGQAYDGTGWDRVETAAFKRVSEIMVRTRVWDAQLGTDGPTTVRKALPEQRRSTGFMLTPDLDILVTPGELSLRDYGRLCRLAPYQEGDRVHRHKLSREGIGADLAAGHNDALVFLEGLSRTGMPSTVTQTLNDWMRNVARVTLFTGVNVVEQDGELVRAAAVPDDARVIEYGSANPPPASFLMVDGEVRVPRGQDALTVRAVLRQVAEPQASTASHHVYRLAPEPLENPEHTLESLRQLHVEGDLPGEFEVAVLAAQGMEACTVETALVVHVPERAAKPVRRDRIAGPLLNRQVAPTQFLVALADLETLRARLEELGVILDLSGYQPA
jgi:hypothetical protein